MICILHYYFSQSLSCLPSLQLEHTTIFVVPTLLFTLTVETFLYFFFNEKLHRWERYEAWQILKSNFPRFLALIKFFQLASEKLKGESFRHLSGKISGLKYIGFVTDFSGKKVYNHFIFYINVQNIQFQQTNFCSY